MAGASIMSLMVAHIVAQQADGRAPCGIIESQFRAGRRMSFISNFRADRLIAEIKSGGNPTGPVAQKALTRLAAMGPSAIAPIVEALQSADKHEMIAYVEVLSKLVDAKSVPLLLSMLAE